MARRVTRHTGRVGEVWGRLVSWGRRLTQGVARHKVIAAVLTAGFGAVVAAFWTFVIDTASEKIAGDKAPVGVTVLPFGDLGYELGLPGDPPVADWSARSKDSELGVVGWAKSHGGGELKTVRRRVVLTGGDRTVVVVGLKARVVGRHPTLPVVVDLTKFGALSLVSIASIDLDAAEPIAVKLLSDEEAGTLAVSGTATTRPEPFFAKQTLSLVKNEPATIDVWIESGGCDCDFELVLDMVVDGARREQVISDADGEPFRVGVGTVEGGENYYELGSCDASVSASSSNALVSQATGRAPGKCLVLG
jgi:hypothetical protein